MLMEGGTGNSVSIWLCFSSTLASMCCGLALAVCCGWLRRKHPKDIFIYLLMHIGIADVLLALWQVFLDIEVIIPSDPGTASVWMPCQSYIFVQRSLIMLTTLDALALAVGMVLQLHSRKRHIPKLLWWSPWLAVPLSIVMELVYILTDEIQEDLNFVELCFSNGTASHVYIFEVLSIFVVTVILHVAVIGQAWHTAPRSVARRSVWSASRYLFAFFMTHVLHVSYKIWLWAEPSDLGECGFEVLRVIGNMCLNLNGLFNFLAFSIHARRVACSQQTATRKEVNFHGERSLIEQLEIPHGEEARKSHKIKRETTNVKDWLNDELGSCLGDLYGRTPSTDSDILTTEMDTATTTASSDGFIDD